MFFGSMLRSASPPPPEEGDGLAIDSAEASIQRNGDLSGGNSGIGRMKLLPDRLRERAMASMSGSSSGKLPELPISSSGTKQTIQARHGTATFVPKGHTIKIINTYGRQVVGFWGFALHAPPTKDEWEADNEQEDQVRQEDDEIHEDHDENDDELSANKAESLGGGQSLEDVQEQEDSESRRSSLGATGIEQQITRPPDENGSSEKEKDDDYKGEDNVDQQASPGGGLQPDDVRQEHDGDKQQQQTDAERQRQEDSTLSQAGKGVADGGSNKSASDVNDAKPSTSDEHTSSKTSRENADCSSPRAEHVHKQAVENVGQSQSPTEQQEAQGQEKHDTKENSSKSSEKSQAPKQGKKASRGWSSFIPVVGGRRKQPAKNEKTIEQGPKEIDVKQPEQSARQAPDEVIMEQVDQDPDKDIQDDQALETAKTNHETIGDEQPPQVEQVNAESDTELMTKSQTTAQGQQSQKEPSASSPTAAQKSWASYLPSLPRLRKADQQQPEQKHENSSVDERTWASYIPSGQGFSTYLPDRKTFSAFATMHQRDPSKSVAEQLYDFSKTPVGAAGLSVATGSGYASSLYAAYSAYNNVAMLRNTNQPGMEFLSMEHTRVSTRHLNLTINDVLVTNLRAPLLTLVEDSGDCIHDSLMAACDPYRYRDLGASKWEEHGSCAENLVLALQELNKQVGLKGSKAIGSDVSVNRIPSPLNLFLDIEKSDTGELTFIPPKNRKGAFVKFRAERDVVIVMSACPQDVTDINGRKPMVAHFLVEVPSSDDLKMSSAHGTEAKQISKPGIKTERQGRAGRTREQALQRVAEPPGTGRRNTGRPPPKKLDRIPASRKSSSQMSVPTKETQRVEPSDPPTPRTTSTVAPAPAATPQPARVTAAAPAAESSIRPSQPSARPARNKPRKLERRTPATASRA